MFALLSLERMMSSLVGASSALSSEGIEGLLRHLNGWRIQHQLAFKKHNNTKGVKNYAEKETIQQT
jgi:hypothetical protein